MPVRDGHEDVPGNPIAHAGMRPCKNLMRPVGKSNWHCMVSIAVSFVPSWQEGKAEVIESLCMLQVAEKTRCIKHIDGLPDAQIWHLHVRSHQRLM